MKKYSENEKELLNEIDILNNNKNVDRFVNVIKQEAIDMGAYLVESRIKSKSSAIESFRSNKTEAQVLKELYRTVILTNPDTIESFSSVDTIVDLLGLRIITNTPDEIYKIANILKEKYNSFLVIDLINKPLVGFEYRAIHMYLKVKMEGIHFEIPMEIQLKTYEMHHTWIGLHDTVYKNSKVNLKDGCTLLPVLFKIFEFSARICKNYYLDERELIDFSAIDCIIEYNSELFEKYKLDIEKSCFLFAKSIYFDKNNNSSFDEETLFNKFKKLRLKSEKLIEAPLHICGDRNLEYATYCIATGNIEGI